MKLLHQHSQCPYVRIVTITFFAEHFRACLFKIATQCLQFRLFWYFDSINWINYSNLAISSYDYVCIVDISEYILQINAFVNEAKDLCCNKFVKCGIIKCEYYFGQVTSRDECVELLEKELIICVTIITDCLR